MNLISLLNALSDVNHLIFLLHILVFVVQKGFTKGLNMKWKRKDQDAKIINITGGVQRLDDNLVYRSHDSSMRKVVGINDH